MTLKKLPIRPLRHQNRNSDDINNNYNDQTQINDQSTGSNLTTDHVDTLDNTNSNVYLYSKSNNLPISPNDIGNKSIGNDNNNRDYQEKSRQFLTAQKLKVIGVKIWACDRCYRLKSKCDSRRPECSVCRKGSHDCTYERGRSCGRGKQQKNKKLEQISFQKKSSAELTVEQKIQQLQITNLINTTNLKNINDRNQSSLKEFKSPQSNDGMYSIPNSNSQYQLINSNSNSNQIPRNVMSTLNQPNINSSVTSPYSNQRHRNNTINSDSLLTHQGVYNDIHQYQNSNYNTSYSSCVNSRTNGVQPFLNNVDTNDFQLRQTQPNINNILQLKLNELDSQALGVFPLYEHPGNILYSNNLMPIQNGVTLINNRTSTLSNSSQSKIIFPIEQRVDIPIGNESVHIPSSGYTSASTNISQSQSLPHMHQPNISVINPYPSIYSKPKDPGFSDIVNLSHDQRQQLPLPLHAGNIYPKLQRSITDASNAPHIISNIEDQSLLSKTNIETHSITKVISPPLSTLTYTKMCDSINYQSDSVTAPMSLPSNIEEIKISKTNKPNLDLFNHSVIKYLLEQFFIEYYPIWFTCPIHKILFLNRYVAGEIPEFIIWGMCALSASRSNHSTVRANTYLKHLPHYKAGSAYFDRAYELAVGYMKEHILMEAQGNPFTYGPQVNHEIVLGFIVLGFAAKSIGENEKSVILISHAVKIAIQLRLDVDPSVVEIHGDLTWLEKESRRRLWWTLCLFDRQPRIGPNTVGSLIFSDRHPDLNTFYKNSIKDSLLYGNQGSFDFESQNTSVQIPAPEILWSNCSSIDSLPNFSLFHPGNDINMVKFFVKITHMFHKIRVLQEMMQADVTEHELSNKLSIESLNNTLKEKEQSDSNIDVLETDTLQDLGPLTNEECNAMEDQISRELDDIVTKLPIWARDLSGCYEFSPDVNSSSPPPWQLLTFHICHHALHISLRLPKILENAAILKSALEHRKEVVGLEQEVYIAYQNCRKHSKAITLLMDKLHRFNPESRWVDWFSMHLAFRSVMVLIIALKIEPDADEQIYIRRSLDSHFAVIRALGRLAWFGSYMTGVFEELIITPSYTSTSTSTSTFASSPL